MVAKWSRPSRNVVWSDDADRYFVDVRRSQASGEILEQAL